MSNIRSTVVMKTDLCGFTSRVKTLPEADLSALLNFHKEFISTIIVRYEGHIVKGEGDSFWMVFPSVTTAALAAVEIQQELRTLQTGKSDDERLTLRVALTLGDVLHQDGDIFGDSVNLAARIESVTPADEIYLSQAAWLALNKAEIGTAFVNEFSLKGMSDLEKIYRINQQHKTRIIRNQVIVFTDLKKMTPYVDSHPTESQGIRALEFMMTQYESYVKNACESYGGSIRLVIADAYLLTFSEAPLALTALDHLQTHWDQFIHQHQIPCPVSVSVHRGDMFIFRSASYGEGINLASRIESIGNKLYSDLKTSSVIVSEKVQQEVIGTEWADKLHKLEKSFIDSISISNPNLQKFLKETTLYQLIRN